MRVSRRHIIYDDGPARPEGRHENRGIAVAGNGRDRSWKEGRVLQIPDREETRPSLGERSDSALTPTQDAGLCRRRTGRSASRPVVQLGHIAPVVLGLLQRSKPPSQRLRRP